jgi:hypothetical protein
MTVAGAVALTVWMVSSAPERATISDRTQGAGAPAADVVRTARPAKKSPTAESSTKKPAAVTAEMPSSSTVIVPSYLVTQPRLADRAQPLLQRGADVQLAAEGFRTPELFMAVAHASRNLEVPFVVLKHRVLNERMTLSKAIAATRPDVNAAEHASQAMAAARADVFEANRGS